MAAISLLRRQGRGLPPAGSAVLHLRETVIKEAAAAEETVIRSIEPVLLCCTTAFKLHRMEALAACPPRTWTRCGRLMIHANAITRVLADPLSRGRHQT